MTPNNSRSGDSALQGREMSMWLKVEDLKLVDIQPYHSWTGPQRHMG